DLGTIVDDDTASIAINDVSVAERNSGTTSAVFTVSLSTSSSRTVTVSYATADGTALAGQDYQATSGTLTFAPGQTAQNVTVLVNGDTTGEPDETFVVNLSSPVNAPLGDAQGVGIILDDDTAWASIGNATVTEGDAGTVAAVFPITLSTTSDHPIGVFYNTATGGSHPATAGVDYQAANTSITIPAGQTTGQIT